MVYECFIVFYDEIFEVLLLAERFFRRGCRAKAINGIGLKCRRAAFCEKTEHGKGFRWLSPSLSEDIEKKHQVCSNMSLCYFRTEGPTLTSRIYICT